MKIWKRSVALVLTAAMLLGLMITGSAAQEPTVYEPVYAIRGQGVALMDVSANSGEVTLREGNYANWIDRLVLPEYAQYFYDILEEATNGDGEVDGLIDDEYYDAGAMMIGFVDGIVDQERFDVMAPAFFAAYDAFEADHPEVFWLNGYVYLAGEIYYDDELDEYWTGIYLILKDDAYEFDIRKEEYRSQTAIRTAMTALADQITAIVAGAPEGNYEKVRYFNTYLTENNEYNTLLHQGLAPESAWEASTALFGSEGGEGPVCEGYAKAMKLLCDAVGIPCVLVNNTGADSDVEDHMWNNVQLDGVWYGVDVTWNDPIVEGTSGKVSGYEREDYLLVGASTVIDDVAFSQDHVVGNSVSGIIAFTNGPVLSDTAYVPVTQPDHTPGDINGDGEVNNKDATRLFQYLSKWDVQVEEAALDINGDGEVNNKDATRLFQYLSKWDVTIN